LDQVSDGLPAEAIVNVGTVASLSISQGTSPGGHIVVSGNLSSGTIDITALNGLGALIGDPGATITAQALTMAKGVTIGGSGTFNVASIVNNGGVILANGNGIPNGKLVISGGTVSGTGHFEIDGASTLEVNTTTSEQIIVNFPTSTPGAIIFDQPSGFTGSVLLTAPHNHLNLFFNGQTPTGATFDSTTNLLTVTGANNTTLDTIKLVPLGGTEPVVVGVSTLPGFGEVTIGTTVLSNPAIPAPDANGIITTTISSADLSNLLQGDQSALRFVAGTEAITLVDGTLSVGADTNEAFVDRLYQGLLLRAPDQAGLSFWDATLNASGKLAVAQGIASSEELAVRFIGATDTDFVTSIYQSILGRPSAPAATDPGVVFWTGLLANPANTRGTIAAALADSAEAKQHWSSTTSAGIFAYNPNALIVREDYQGAFGREADTGGLSFWTSFLSTGGTASQLAQNFAGSAEFQALHGSQTDNQYVESLYQSNLGRASDPGGSAFWVGQLGSSAMTRGDVLTAFAQSPEAAQHLHWALT
jgi:hypothetical protein